MRGTTFGRKMSHGAYANNEETKQANIARSMSAEVMPALMPLRAETT
jgi:hypothetical protein